MPRLKSMDVTIAHVTRSFEFDPPIEVDSDDEGEASLEVLRDAETTEVVLTNGVSSATVTVEYEVRYTSTVEFEVEDLNDAEIEDESDIIDYVERGDAYGLEEAIEEDIRDNLDSSWFSTQSVTVDSVEDENGNDVEL